MKLLHFFLFSLLTLSACKKSTSTAPPAASITDIQCAAAGASGSLQAGISFTGTFTLPYTGGNGAAYAGGAAIPSTGVTGLSATLQGGTLANGSGQFTYTVSGTPSTSGTARFAVSFAGMSCTVSLPVGEVAPVQYGTPFTGVPDRQDATIYQVNMRAFSAGSNLAGVTARLDSIRALGVNVVYLMPIYPVGTVRAFNSPYSIRDYRSVGAEFGTLADLRNLVDGAHSRNMSVILDWVANHTAWDHPWISASPNWYLRDASGTIQSPPGTGWNDVAQLDFSNADMRLEMIRSMKYWVYAANIDGFRFDYADGPPASFWRQAIDTLRAISTHRLLLLAEGSRPDHYTAGFDFTFGFNFYGTLKNVMRNNQPATQINTVNTTEYTNASAGQQVVRYITNHDVNGSDGTPQQLFGGIPGSLAAFVVAAYMKGVPMIYNGQEVATPFQLTFPFTSADINWSLNPEVTAEYKRIIAFRNSSMAIRRAQPVSYTTADVCAFTKEAGGEQVFVAVNLRNSAVTYTLPAGVANSNWTSAWTGASLTAGSQLELMPYGYVVWRR
jgi:glycosidase